MSGVNDIYKINKKIYLWILVIINLIESLSPTKFYFHMDKTTMRCLGEYLSDKTLGNDLTDLF